jgi:hypothetical protein
LLDFFSSSGIYLEDPYFASSGYGWSFLYCSAITIEMLEAVNHAYFSFLLSLTVIENLCQVHQRDRPYVTTDAGFDYLQTAAS